MDRRTKARRCHTESSRRRARQSEPVIACKRSAKQESQASSTDIDKGTAKRQTRLQMRFELEGAANDAVGSVTTPGSSVAEIREKHIKTITGCSVSKTGSKDKSGKTISAPKRIVKSVDKSEESVPGRVDESEESVFGRLDKSEESAPGRLEESAESVSGRLDKSEESTPGRLEPEENVPGRLDKSEEIVFGTLTKSDIRIMMSELRCPLPDFRGRQVSITEILSCFMEPNEQQVVRLGSEQWCAKNLGMAIAKADAETSVCKIRDEDINSLGHPLNTGKREMFNAEDLNKYMEFWKYMQRPNESRCAKNLEVPHIDGKENMREEGTPVIVASARDFPERQIAEIPLDAFITLSDNDSDDEMENFAIRSPKRGD